MYKLLVFLFGISLSNALYSQELNASVTVNIPIIQQTDPKVIKTLENSIKQFLNNTAWTNETYRNHEKIECSFIFNITDEISANSFNADLQIQALRPTYMSNYKTVVFTHVDKNVTFEFDEFAPIDFSENVFNSNLSSILSYYVFIILGLDHDTFAPKGGDAYFQKAQDIVNSIPTNLTNTYKGWRSLDGNVNRFWLVDNLLSPRTQDFRIAYYNYHRAGHDILYNNPAEGIATIEKSIKQIQAINKSQPNSMLTTFFVNAKSQEIIEIFKGGTKELRSSVYQNMIRLDAANASKYKEIK